MATLDRPENPPVACFASLGVRAD